jgi:hypothetical protein
MTVVGTFETSTNVRYAVRFGGKRTSAAIAELFANFLRRASRMRRSSIGRAAGRITNARVIRLRPTISLAGCQAKSDRTCASNP